MAFLSTFTDSSKPSGGAEMRALFESIQAGNRHAFLQPTSAISSASLQLAKATLDSYAGQISDEQQQRQKEANKKRKRADPSSKTEVLKIRRLHVDGFESGQVWQQARRIIASTLQDSKEALEELEDRKEVHVNGVNGDATSLGSPEAHSEVDPGSEDDPIEEFSDSEEDLDEDEEGISVEDDDELSGELPEDDFEEGLEDIEEEDDENFDENEEEDEDESSGTLVQDPNGLNDGFFSIDDFNKQTQWFEEQDARANPDADEASDDEDVDWHADPSASVPLAGNKPSKKSKQEDDDALPSDMEDDEDEDGGPVFGNMDLDAPEGESDLDEEEEDVDGESDHNANDVFYKDFFAPPKRKGPPRKGKPYKPTEPRSAAPADQDVDRAMADVHRDLFEDESEREDSDDALSDASAGDPKSRKSAHERRQAKLAEEIRTLEAANVAKREWALAGEAKAIDRPLNSLLEEDLDFEHIGKPVPVITTEVSEDIEEMIKRRILAQEFDEVVKRRPDSADLSTSITRRGLVDLEDTKAKQSLAELYEEEHVQSANPDAYVSKSDEKLRREEREVEQMWRDVSAKLDALSSWHYRPKPAAPSLTVVADVAAVSMEDAQPATAQGVTGGDTALAPQEVYAPGRDTAEKGEVVLAKSGLPLAKQEMSREDRTRRRRRQKERIRKAGSGAVNGDGANGATAANGGGKAGDKVKKTRAQEQKDTLDNLKKGGVKVINKKGEVVDMEGNKARAAKAATSQSFKL